MAKHNGDKPQGKEERIIDLVDSTLKEIKTLAESYEKISKTRDNRRKADSEIAAKEARSRTEYEKEKNRAKEEMARIELDIEKARYSFAKGDLHLSMIEKMVQETIAEYNRFNTMDEEEFLGEKASKCRDNIRRNIIEMMKLLAQ